MQIDVCEDIELTYVYLSCLAPGGSLNKMTKAILITFN